MFRVVDAKLLIVDFVVRLEGGKMNVGQIIYLDRARIFRRLRFSLRIRFLRHLALMVQQDCKERRYKDLKTTKDQRISHKGK